MVQAKAKERIVGDNTSTPAMLVVWANIPAEHEADFNRWYDNEHVQERVAISGFVNGARYFSADGQRHYLGLYRTQSLGTFTSDAYKAAFGKQTQWSVTNLQRMTDCVRRVCTIPAETGAGTGGFIAFLRFGRAATDADLETMASAGRALQELDGIIATRLLVPSVELSTPLPTESREGRLLDPILVIETTTREAAEMARKQARAAFGNAGEDAVLQLMWILNA